MPRPILTCLQPPTAAAPEPVPVAEVNPAPAAASAPASIRQDQSPGREPQPLLFAREDWSLYTSLATLPQRAGVSASMLPWLVAKEFCDNALDAADAAGRPGAVEISVDEAGNLIVDDQGTGIPGATPQQLARLFCVARPMLSSKLLRRPTRGAVGNGLRVCLGYLTATRGQLVIETGSVRVELTPDIDGTNRIINSSTIEPRQGLRLTAIAGDAPFANEHLAWAEDAVELARQSGTPAFTGRPSPHWLDLDHFRVLLRAAVGNVSVRQFLGELDGCTGSRAQSKIAAGFLRRAAADLDALEAAELLVAAQAATKPPKPKALRPLGRDAVLTGGYAIADGTFTEGQHEPQANIPFLVECWADGFRPEEQAERLTCALYMNRTRAIAPCTGNAWHGQLDLSMSGTTVRVPVPAGPHYAITVNITSPMFRLTSDGKAPDCHPFRNALIEAIGKAAKQGGHDVAALMSAEQKRAAAQHQQEQREEAQQQRIADREARQHRLAQVEAEKAKRKAEPDIDDVVRELLPGAIKIEEASGLLFNTRRLLYRIRDRVQQRTGKELKQKYFDVLLTKIEAEQGDLSPLLIREPRGSFSIPHHHGGATPLGTQAVRKFQRPAWYFNKVVAIEKEDLRLMLEQAGWDRRHDAFLMSAKGFNTRAARDLIDKIGETAEPVKVFSVHDADAHGTLIHHTLQNATLARAARKVEIIDLGLQPWEGVALGLPIEKVPVNYNKDHTPRRRPVADYVRAGTDRAPNGETWEAWLQYSRIELNAFTSAELIDWLNAKMEELGDGKLIPPDDILQEEFGDRVRERVETALAEKIEQQLNNQISTIEQAKAEAIRLQREEMGRITAPVRELLVLLEAPFLERISLLKAPFNQETEEARAESEAIDQVAKTERVIDRIMPEDLRAAIDEAFADKPEQRWVTVLHEIADGTEIDVEDEGEE
jgi:DNA topoisomerase VI subunit B